MPSDFPRFYEQLRSHVFSIANALHAAEAAGIAQRWGARHKDGRTMDAVEAKAIHDIESRIARLCDFAGVRSKMHETLVDQIYALQAENRSLRERLKHSDAALVRLTAKEDV